MSGPPSAGPTDGADWPVPVRGVTETVVTTHGPNDRWNVAVLGLFAGESVTARTWGNTRTKKNFDRRGQGYVQFVDDPVTFVRGALTIEERDGPILDEARAWAKATVERLDSGTDRGTDWVEWKLRPVESTVERETVPTINRGFGLVVEATVAASRLDVPAADQTVLRERLEYFSSVIERTGGPREREALTLIRESSDW